MNTISALKEVYGYSTPIFLKDLHIRGKSKSAIRKELSRAVEKGEIIREAQGVYFFDPKDGLPHSLSVNQVLELRYIKDDWGLPGLDFNVFGYYSGLTFLNQIGISQQVPAIIEITTNRTSCKRIINFTGRKALLRKGKIEISRFNYKTLQFFDAFYSLDLNDIKKNYELLYNYASKNISKQNFELYIGLYPIKILKKIVEGKIINAFR